MALSYKNYGKDLIINNLRDIRFANSELLFGQLNTVNINFEVKVDVQQLSNQADVFAQHMMIHRSDFDFKRFLGPYSSEWKRLFHETYIYDRCRAIYYGLNAMYLFEVPKDKKSFPGNIVLFNMLSKRNFSFNSSDNQPYQIFANILHPGRAENVLEEVFKKYPNIEKGMSNVENVISYVNPVYDAILEGMWNGRKFLLSDRFTFDDDNGGNDNQNRGGKGKKKEVFFQLKRMDDPTLANVLSEESNPLLNSFLSADGGKFFFIHPANISGPGKMKFNESVFLSRALGFTSEQLTFNDNNFYLVATRPERDFLTSNDVYSVTGIKTEVTPSSSADIDSYTQKAPYIKGENKGDDNSGGTSPTP